MSNMFSCGILCPSQKGQYIPQSYLLFAGKGLSHRPPHDARTNILCSNLIVWPHYPFVFIFLARLVSCFFFTKIHHR
jgi:hypothetical protein